MNGFLEIKDDEINRFVTDYQDGVRDKVASRVATYNLLGNVAELFFPVMADTLTVMLGGEASVFDSDYLTIEEGGWVGDDPPAGPTPPEDAVR